MVSVPPMSGIGRVKMLARSHGQDLVSPKKTPWSKCRCNGSNLYKLVLIMRRVGYIYAHERFCFQLTG